MKNIIKRVLLIALGTILVCGLFSCTANNPFSRFVKPANADVLIQRISNAMGGLSSYGCDTEMSLQVGIGTNLVKSQADAKSVVCNGKNNDYYFYQKTTAKSTAEDKYGETLSEQTTENLYAFDGGNAFYMEKDDDKTVQLYSESTPKDFAAFLKQMDGTSTDMLFYGCSEKEMTQEEDDSWTLKLGGYSKESFQKIWTAFEIGEISEMTESSNLTLTVKADKEYRLTSVKLHLLISEKEDESDYESVMDATITYGSYNAAERVEGEYSTEEYTNVGNVLVLLDAVKQLRAWSNLENGEFEQAIEQVSKAASGHKKTVTVNDTIAFSTDGKDGFSYTIEERSSENESQVVTLQYSDGTLYMKVNGELNKKQSVSDNNAKKTIRTILQGISLDPAYVTLVEDKGDGVYEIRADKALEEADDLYREYTYLVRLTFREGKLVSAASEIKLVGKDGTSVEMNTELTQKN